MLWKVKLAHSYDPQTMVAETPIQAETFADAYEKAEQAAIRAELVVIGLRLQAEPLVETWGLGSPAIETLKIMQKTAQLFKLRAINTLYRGGISFLARRLDVSEAEVTMQDVIEALKLPDQDSGLLLVRDMGPKTLAELRRVFNVTRGEEP